MRNKTIDVLIEMGVPADCCGFQYIVDAMFLLDNLEWRNEKLTALYYKIGTINNVSVSKVERGIRTAFATVFRNGNKKMVERYLSTQNKKNGNLLYVLHYRLTQGV